LELPCSFGYADPRKLSRDWSSLAHSATQTQEETELRQKDLQPGRLPPDWGGGKVRDLAGQGPGEHAQSLWPSEELDPNILTIM